jgi:uncharacterized membrane protein YkoI
MMKNLQKNLPKTVRYYFLPVMLFLALTAVNVYMFQQSPGTEAPKDLATDNKTFASSLPSHLLSIDSIKDLAAKEAPRATISKIELQSKDSKLVYVVDMTDSSSLSFDAETGAKLSVAKIANKKPNVTLPVDFDPQLDFSNAQEIALDRHPKGTITKIELAPQKDKVVVYHVSFTDGSTVDVAATDGTIVDTTGSVPAAPDTASTETTTEDTTTSSDIPVQDSTSPQAETAPVADEAASQ